MAKLLSSTAASCSRAVREKFASANRSKVRTLGAFTSLTLIALAIACSDATQHPAAPSPSGVDLPGPVFAIDESGNGPGSCLLKSTQDGGYLNNITSLNCTSNDVDIAFASVTQYSINGAPFQALATGSRIACVPGDEIRAVTDALIANNASERYDFGLWINPNGSALTGASCLHFNLIPGQNNSTSLDETPDACGDIASDADTVTIPLDTLTLVCPGGGATTVTVDACAAWANGTTGANDRVCPKPGVVPASEGFREATTPGTTAKCRCEPLNLPIDVKGVIRVQKQTLPDGATQSFTFTPSYNAGATFDLTDGQTNASPPLSAGTYTAAETVPAGWTLTGRECHVTGTATNRAIGSVTNGVSVVLGAGEDITCVFTNTKNPTLTVNKVCAPTNDTGKFDLRIDGSVAGSGDDALCGGTTGAVEVSVGSHTVSELAGTGTNLSNYTTVIGGQCGTDGSVTLAAGDAKVCTITNTRKPTLTVNKVCVPTGDTGKFNLRIDGSVAGTGGDAACGGTTGAVVTTVGAHTVSELAGTGTNLGDYASLIGGNCAADGTITLTAGQNAVCTITNTKKATLTVNKVCVPTSDGGKFNLRIDGSVAGTGGDVACGGTTGAVTVTATSHTVSETAGTGTNLNAYSTVIGGQCAADGTVTLAPGDNKVCTITNSRLPTFQVKKVCDPTTDAGRFDLRIKGSAASTDVACGGQTNAVIVAIGDGSASNFVGEQGNGSTSLTSFTTTLSCTKNGQLISGYPTGTLTPDGSGIIQQALGTTLAAGDVGVCTFTNVRKPTLTVNKVCLPTGDGGKFNLRIDGNTVTADAACGGTTGQQVVTVGSHTVAETAGTSTDLNNYTTLIGGDCAADGSVTVGAGQNKVCTITNTRKPTLRVDKICLPSNDAGAFNLRIDGSTAGNGANAACGGSTGAVVTTTGSHTVSETAGTNTDLGAYTSLIGGACGTDGTVNLTAGQNAVCTITNTRKPVIRVLKATVPTTDPGKFDFTIGATGFNNSGAGYGNGQGTSYQTVAIGSVSVAETGHTGTVLGNYVPSLGCGSKTVNPNNGSSGTVSAAAGDSITCTFTNSRKAVLIVDKILTGGGAQLFDFSQTGISNFQLADATTPKKTVDLTPGSYTVCELGLAVAWNATATVNGSPVTLTVDGTTGNACRAISLAYGDSTTIVFTNAPPPGGGTRTIGYWKNWSSCAQSKGGQYSKAIAKGTPEATLDFNLPIAVSVTNPLGDLTALTCAQAVNLLAKSAINGDKRAGDPIYNMIAQMLGARLNVAAQAGVCTDLTTALSQAQAFLDALNFNGTGSYKGVLSSADQQKVNGWGGVFGSYNEGTLGGGCPTHV